MTSQEFHDLNAPNSRCECDHCEMMRLFEDWDEWAYCQGRAEHLLADYIDPEVGPCWHQHHCTGCGDYWDCENDLCEASETVDDRCDGCEDGQ